MLPVVIWISRICRISLVLAAIIAAVSCTDFGAFDLIAQLQGTRVPEQLALIASSDTDIFNDAPATNYGVATSMVLNHGTGGLGKRRLLVEFDLSTLPAGATISAATLVLSKIGGATSEIHLDLHRITNPWIEVEATWNNRDSANAWLAAGADIDPTLVARVPVTDDGQYRWEGSPLTALVNGWHQGTVGNYGILIGCLDTGDADRFFATRTHTDPSSRPRLEVSYIFPD